MSALAAALVSVAVFAIAVDTCVRMFARIAR